MHDRGELQRAADGRVGLERPVDSGVGTIGGGTLERGVVGPPQLGDGVVRAIAMGADWANSARGFMFAIGCIQGQACHTNRCPVGVATQDKLRARALDVGDKSRRVANFHRNTMKALAEMAGAAGLEDPCSFLPHHFMQRDKSGEMLSGDQAWRWLPEGFLISGEPADAGYLDRWNRARPDSFKPV